MKYAIAIATVVILVFLSFAAAYAPVAFPWDYCYTLSEQVVTITVQHIDWACDCSDWEVLGEPEDGPLEERTIFIEGEDIDHLLPDGCWPTLLLLTGQFYQNKGISRRYDLMFEKPDKARVFKYTSAVIVEKDCNEGLGIN